MVAIESTNGRGRTATRIGVGTALLALPLLVLMLVSPAMGASVTVAPTTLASFSAPYTTATAYEYPTSLGKGCGGSNTTTNPGTFNTTTGRATELVTLSMRSCAMKSGAEDYDHELGVQYLNWTATRTALSVNFTAHWQVYAWLNMSVTPAAGSPAKAIEAQVEVNYNTWVYDLTTGVLNFSGEAGHLYSDYNGTMNLLVAKNHVLVDPVQITKGHTYEILTEIDVGFDVLASKSEGKGGSASITVLLPATGKHGTFLESVTI